MLGGDYFEFVVGGDVDTLGGWKLCFVWKNFSKPGLVFRLNKNRKWQRSTTSSSSSAASALVFTIPASQYQQHQPSQSHHNLYNDVSITDDEFSALVWGLVMMVTEGVTCHIWMEHT